MKNNKPKTVKIGELECIVAKLLGGPYDGCETISSHGSAWHGNEHYCHVEYNGDEKDVFRHSKSYLAANTPGGDNQIVRERKRVAEWMDASVESVAQGGLPVPMSTLIPIPVTRIGVHRQMLKAGA